MNNFYQLFMLAAAGMISFAITGCDKTDLTAPTIALAANGALAPDEAEALAGSALNITIDLADDEELGSLRIDLHSGAGHEHEEEEDGEFALFSGSEDFGALETVNLFNGTQQLVSRDFDIPGNVRGHWHLIVDATDAAGNEAETAYMEIHIENDSIPLFEVPYAAEPVWAAGTTVNLAGSLTDADGLASATARLQDEAGALLAEVAIPLTPGDVAVDLASVSFDLPASAGEVEVVLEATDLLGFNCLTSFHAEVE
jgi:hypothetical protein